MTPIVQAKCPHCQNTLRIPSDWINQPLKCKHCQQIFQTRGKAGQTAATPQGNVLTPAHAVAPGQPASGGVLASAPTTSNLFGFDQLDGGPGVGKDMVPSARKSGAWWKVGILGIGVLMVAVGVLAFAGSHLSNLFTKDKDKDKTPVAQVKDKEKPVEPSDKSGKNDKAVTPDDKKSEEIPKVVDKDKRIDGQPKKSDDSPKKTDDAPKKIDNPKKKDNEPRDKEIKINPKAVAAAFPRRALLINVNNYLFLNSLHYGSSRSGNYSGSSTSALHSQLQLPPMNFPATQITELSDGIMLPSKNVNDPPRPDPKRSWPTLKPVIESAINDFLDGSRPQDRIMILFAGHAVEIDKEAYLIPVEGNKDDAKTLIPLAWVYKKLADCRARQKVLVLDVFRFPPARGFELPGTGEMTDDFDTKLLNPPAGVQVWSACIKGQQSIEFEGGSAFLQAWCGAMQDQAKVKGLTNPQEDLPLDKLLVKVNTRLKELLAPQKLEQVSRLTGREAEGGAAYDKDEPLPPALALKPPVPPGGLNAGRAQVIGILDELTLIPPAKASYKQISYESMPPFRAKAIELYKTDYATLKELRDKVAADKKKYALREAVLEMADMMNKSMSLKMRESLTSSTGAVTPAMKTEFKKIQEGPGQLIFEMEDVLEKALKAGAAREAEVSPRWQANYDYALARFQTRLIYLYEYNNILAQVRGDALPEIDPKIHNGYRVGATLKPNVKDVPKVKEYAKDIKKAWKKIIDEHPDTPWAILAQRESQIALGLEWRLSRD